MVQGRVELLRQAGIPESAIASLPEKAFVGSKFSPASGQTQITISGVDRTALLGFQNIVGTKQARFRKGQLFVTAEFRPEEAPKVFFQSGKNPEIERLKQTPEGRETLTRLGIDPVSGRISQPISTAGFVPVDPVAVREAAIREELRARVREQAGLEDVRFRKSIVSGEELPVPEREVDIVRPPVGVPRAGIDIPATVPPERAGFVRKERTIDGRRVTTFSREAIEAATAQQTALTLTALSAASLGISGAAAAGAGGALGLAKFGVEVGGGLVASQIVPEAADPFLRKIAAKGRTEADIQLAKSALGVAAFIGGAKATGVAIDTSAAAVRAAVRNLSAPRTQVLRQGSLGGPGVGKVITLKKFDSGVFGLDTTPDVPFRPTTAPTSTAVVPKPSFVPSASVSQARSNLGLVIVGAGIKKPPLPFDPKKLTALKEQKLTAIQESQAFEAGARNALGLKKLPKGKQFFEKVVTAKEAKLGEIETVQRLKTFSRRQIPLQKLPKAEQFLEKPLFSKQLKLKDLGIQQRLRTIDRPKLKLERLPRAERFLEAPIARKRAKLEELRIAKRFEARIRPKFIGKAIPKEKQFLRGVTLKKLARLREIEETQRLRTATRRKLKLKRLPKERQFLERPFTGKETRLRSIGEFQAFKAGGRPLFPTTRKQPTTSELRKAFETQRKDFAKQQRQIGGQATVQLVKPTGFATPGSLQQLSKGLQKFKPPVETLFERETRIIQPTEVKFTGSTDIAKFVNKLQRGEKNAFGEFKKAGEAVSPSFKSFTTARGPKLGVFLGGIPKAFEGFAKAARGDQRARQFEKEREKALAGASVFFKPTPKRTPRERDFIGNALSSLGLSRPRELPRERERQRAAILDLTKPFAIPRAKPRVSDRERQRQREKQRQKEKEKEKEKQKTRTLPRLRLGKARSLAKTIPKTGKGFDVLLKVKGQFKKQNVNPLHRKTALSLGSLLADKTAAQTFFVRRTNRPASGPKKALSSRLRKFRKPIRRGRTIPGSPLFIERKKFLIDSPGERKEITEAGLRALRTGFFRKKRKKRKRRLK